MFHIDTQHDLIYGLQWYAVEQYKFPVVNWILIFHMQYIVL